MKTRAVRFHETGGPEVLRIEEVELPEPGAGEVLVRIEAIGLNRAEAAYRAGQYLEAPQLPSRLGYEAAGVIEIVGEGVGAFAVGEAVCVLPAFSMNRYGVYAERAIVPAKALVRRPQGMGAREAAAVWMQYLTAWGGLVDVGGLSPGDALLITAASSSVGLAAIQIANAVGAVPIAVTRSASKVSALKAHGAAHVLVCPSADALAERIGALGGLRLRLAFDPVAGPGVQGLAQALAPGGTLILYGNLGGEAERTPFPFVPAVGKGLAVRGYLVFETIGDAQRFARGQAFITAGLRSGALEPVIDRVFPFEDIVAAHRHLEGNGQVGKIVVSVSG